MVGITQVKADGFKTLLALSGISDKAPYLRRYMPVGMTNLSMYTFLHCFCNTYSCKKGTVYVFFSGL